MLTSEQLEFFNHNGYLVVDQVLDQKAALDPVRAEYDRLLEQLYANWYQQGQVKAAPDGMTFDQKLIESYRSGCDWFRPFDISLPGDKILADTPMHFGPAIFDMVTNSRLLDIVESLIGPEISSNPIQHIRIKPPAPDLQKGEVRAHITSTDWHQDRAVALAEADQTNMITVWCAVTDATEENGCLQVIPRVHQDGMKPHCPRTQTAIADNQIDVDQAVSLPVKSGGIVIFHPLTPHASLINRSTGIRWSFDLRFNVTGEPTGRAHFPEFVARSANKPELELKDWWEWRNLWYEARARLADSPHIDIHRWSADAPACA
ncbi:MAG: phytanoyl-CoA dioxygenase [Rhizobiaceae bacterium]|nr:phytanoyl-CoA dioxygenase [Rhizobiaceae bacterium]